MYISATTGKMACSINVTASCRRGKDVTLQGVPSIRVIPQRSQCNISANESACQEKHIQSRAGRPPTEAIIVLVILFRARNTAHHFAVHSHVTRRWRLKLAACAEHCQTSALPLRSLTAYLPHRWANRATVPMRY